VSELTGLVDLAERTALAVADLLRAGVGRDDLHISSKATSTDLVTDVDRTAEQLIVSMIQRERPHDGILGEEGANVTGTSGVDWIVDPLDGTTNFVYGHPGFSVSIAALVDGIASVGVVADPVHHDLYSASIGRGAHCNGVAITCAPAQPLGNVLVATGFAYDPDERARQARVLATVLPAIRDIRRMGGAAIDLCSVARGRVDAYYEWGLQAWDMAAGVVIASESGAKVGDLSGDLPSSQCCVACHPDVFGPLTELLSSALAEPS
jgi:myo-inositol-1(or 4)-monophosphatase